MEENALRPADVARLVGRMLKHLVRHPFTLKKVFWSGNPRYGSVLWTIPLTAAEALLPTPFPPSASSSPEGRLRPEDGA